ncbi:Protein bassoon, partial [Bienertia sinuspersici]
FTIGFRIGLSAVAGRFEVVDAVVQGLLIEISTFVIHDNNRMSHVWLLVHNKNEDFDILVEDTDKCHLMGLFEKMYEESAKQNVYNPLYFTFYINKPRTNRKMDLADDSNMLKMWEWNKGKDTIEVWVEETKEEGFVCKSAKANWEKKLREEAIRRRLLEEELKRKAEMEEDERQIREQQQFIVSVEVPVVNAEDHQVEYVRIFNTDGMDECFPGCSQPEPSQTYTQSYPPPQQQNKSPSLVKHKPTRKKLTHKKKKPTPKTNINQQAQPQLSCPPRQPTPPPPPPPTSIYNTPPLKQGTYTKKGHGGGNKGGKRVRRKIDVMEAYGDDDLSTDDDSDDSDYVQSNAIEDDESDDSDGVVYDLIEKDELTQFLQVFIDFYIKEGFAVTVEKADNQRYTAACVVESYNWRIHATVLKDNVSWAIKTLTSKHSTCGRLEENPMVSSEWFDKAVDMNPNDLTEYAHNILKIRADESRLCHATACEGGEFEVRVGHVKFPVTLSSMIYG